METMEKREAVLRDIDPEDEQNISNAYEIFSVLGEGYLSLDKLRSYAKKEILIGAFLDEKMIGAVATRVMDSDDFKIIERRMGRDGLESLRLPRDRKTCTVYGIAVNKAYRRLGKSKGPGAGSLLVIESLRRARDSGCEVLFAESWVTDSGDESKNLFERLGAELKLEVSGYWSEEEEYCPVCKSNNCKCKALIYVGSLKEILD